MIISRFHNNRFYDDIPDYQITYGIESFAFYFYNNVKIRLVLLL